MRPPRVSRIRFARLSGALLAATAIGALFWPAAARAQLTGTSQKPLPDVLLLVDTSGSMERMTDNSLPELGLGACSPGNVSEPNRWGMLIQALTGNLQPYFSCAAIPRDQGASSFFVQEYSINGKAPYDSGYFLPYHRPLTGSSAANACAMAPFRLPGPNGGAGVGPNNRNVPSTSATDFPDDALASVNYSYLSSNQNLPVPLPAANECLFDQALDGQLDAARDYARFGLMTFDSDIDEHIGVTVGNLVDTSAVVGSAVQPPFLGQWSYYRSPSNPDYVAPGAVQGHPPGCGFTFFEVGARSDGAPPWEGRMVKFPAPDATLYDIQRINDQIQKVLLASRPFGATPIDGLMDDARDYYWYRNGGVKDDPYLCRNKFIVLLTDGAPNLNMRPSCGASGAGDKCPYPQKAAEIAYALRNDGTTTRQVTTYVIGFSVNGSGAFPGDGFPTGYTAPPKNNCKTWYDEEGANNPITMQNRCNTLYASGSIPEGSTADACCKLNEIALKGSDPASPEGPFFAESQADIVLSFGKILANIIKSATTRTLPAFSPAAQLDSVIGSTAGQFIASFIPNAQRPWSGELDRTRFKCSTAGDATPAPQDATKGDYMSANLSQQSKSKERLFISVLPDQITGGSIDSAATIRPFANSTTPSSFTGGPDNIPKSDGTTNVYSGKEISFKNNLNYAGFKTDWQNALDIDDHTCKRTKAVKKGLGAGPRGTVIVPALSGPDCTDVVWGFTTAYPDSILKTGQPVSAPAYDFNIRCTGSGSSTVGTCSVTPQACTMGVTVGLGSCPSGEICIPECSALGAIYRANPTVIGPPSSFLREEGFRTFQSRRNGRRPVTFAATTDGILHAFKAMEEGPTSAKHELWAFVPPAVLPKLASNYPAGNQVLLDGSPVVRETIWERAAADASSSISGNKWHTTLVAGLGAGGGGYYALNVTDADCGGKDSVGDCLNPTNFELPDQGNFDHVSFGGHAFTDTSVKKGPHFLWQLTDVLKNAGDTAKVVRKNRHNDEMVALFGKQTGTPAIGMVQITGASGEQRQVGVAILPGGIDGPPVKGEQCSRGGGVTSMHDSATGSARTAVRKWAKDCSAPVPGRGVTIVRLDTGEVIRHFGRLVDTPKRLGGRLTETNFDSPMIGTPVVYPDTIGVPIQKVFIGDADGTVWRIDLTSTKPEEWKAALFQDLYSVPGNGPLDGQPIQVPPVLSTDDAGQVVINVATGDQENITLGSDKNYVYSLREQRNLSGASLAKVNWYRELTDTDACPTCGARVTGPMVVFDKTLYFASYAPKPPSGSACGEAGVARLWGMHYTDKDPAGGLSVGGLPRFCKDGFVDANTGACNTALVDSQSYGSDVIPGVAMRTSLACSSLGATDEVGGTGFGSFTPSEYHLSFGVAKPSGGAGGTVADRAISYKRPLPRTSTKIDAWSLVIE